MNKEMEEMEWRYKLLQRAALFRLGLLNAGELTRPAYFTNEEAIAERG